MGREVRRVPATWHHPKDERGRYIPLYTGDAFSERIKEWDDGAELWSLGLIRDWCSGAVEPIPAHRSGLLYEEYAGARPRAEDYMPQWAPEERTYYMMYENTSEGTPISPAFGTPEELARWLADTGASAFAGMTVDYEHWLAVARGASAVSLAGIATDQGSQFVSGISLLETDDPESQK